LRSRRSSFADSLLYSVPYAPFSKSDKITHVADFIGETDPAAAVTQTRGTRGGARGGARGNQREAYGASTAAATGNFGFERDEDERSFSLVDAGRVVGAAKGRGTGLFVGRGRGRGTFARGGAAGGRGGRGGASNFGARGDNRGINSSYRGRGRGGYGGYNSWDKVSFVVVLRVMFLTAFPSRNVFEIGLSPSVQIGICWRRLHSRDCKSSRFRWSSPRTCTSH
jgi:hypothetical protein